LQREDYAERRGIQKNISAFWIERDAQASIKSARQGRAWFGKARLGHTMVLRVEGKIDDVSNRGSLKKTDYQRNGQLQ
jgi:hypothetical protein